MKRKPGSQFAFFNPRVLIAMLFLGGLVLGLFAFGAFPGTSARAEGSTQNSKSGLLHKVSVSDPGLAQTLRSQGARMIADYGGFALLEMNDETASGLTNNPSAQIVDENNMILLNAGAIDATTPEAQALRSATATKSGKQMRLIQFAGPIRPEWYEALVVTGAHIVTYIPSNAYLVYGTAQTLQAVRTLASDESMVQWDGDYPAAYRLDPAVTSTTGTRENLSAQGNEQFIIQMVEDEAENVATLALIEQFKLEPIIKEDSMLGYLNVTVALPRDAVIHQIAERGDVVSIQQWITPTLLCERQDIIMTGNITGNPAVPTPMDYLAYLTGKGFTLGTPATFGVNVSDTGLDNGTTTPFQFLLYTLGDATSAANSRVNYVVAQGTAAASDLPGCNGHGNLNCTIIGGYVPTGVSGSVNFGAFPHADASGFRWGLGVAPFVRVGLSVIFKTTGAFTNPNYANLESQAYQQGMRISSNSWGAAVGGAYNSDSQAYDALVRDAQPAGSTFPTAGNQEYTIVFSAGNSGSGAATIGAPGTAKNVITVGAAENVNPFGGADGSGIDDTGANNANDIISFSSRGPTTDGRKKPDIMGPGTHVSGGAPQNAANPGRTGNGTVLACFTGNGVSGGIGGSKFFPAGQQWYTASSGTSHSCPATAGAAALIRQHFINQSLTPPSPAMTKALLMNSARYMTGTGANDTLPSNNQGMGEVNLNSFFDVFSTVHVFHDETAADLFTATGQVRTITGTVSTSAKPFRVTLAWTDTPGPTSGNAFVNNLDLQVTVGGNTYKGNVFTGASSSTGGVADTQNNVESVFVPAGVSGAFTITVTATNIAGDGVPGNASPLDQDFALVAYNATASSATPTPTPTPTHTPTPTPTHTPTPTPVPTATPIPTPSATPSPTLVATVTLPIATVTTAVTNFTQPVVTSAINPADNLVGFQGDFTFNETVVTFQSPPVSNAGLTGGNWNVSGNVLPGAGPIRILRVSAFSNDFTPLSGSGTLYNLNMTRVSSTPGATTPLVWQPDPDNFIFIDGDLNTHAPGTTPSGSITIQAGTVAVSGTVIYCSNPALDPVPNVTLTLSGSGSGSTLSDGSGNYTFSSLTPGGSYTVTPTKSALAPGSAGISTVDVVAVQRHFLNIASLPPGCRLMAADVNGDTSVNTVDVIAIQRFFLGLSTGIANTGKYLFNPASTTYTAIATNQTGQNYNALVFGDVASGFVHRSGGSGDDGMSAGEIAATVAAVSLPEIAMNQSKSNFTAAVRSSAIDAKNTLVGFQGDFTFDERVVTFQSEPVQKAGITGGNWNVSGNVLAGPGPIRTLRISAYSNDFTPLSGEGTLFELRVRTVSGSALPARNASHSDAGGRIPNSAFPLLWAAPPDGFIFIDADLNTQKPGGGTVNGDR